MKRFIPILSLCALAVPAAFAQESVAVGVSIKIGQFDPQGRVARAQGKKWILAGGDMKIKDLKHDGKGNGQYITISADYVGKNDMASIPVMVNYVSRAKEWYFLAGAGAAYSKDFRIIGPDTVTSENVEVAYCVGIGYDFQNWKTPLFAEARFLGNGNDRLNGVVIAVGVRL